MANPNLQELQNEIKNKTAFLQVLRSEMGRIIAGQEKLIDRLMLALVANGHVLLEGVPGLAKTLAVKTLSQSLNGKFSRLQFTPDLLPADLIGSRIYNAATQEFMTRLGSIFANIVLADEINRAPAKVQSALLECMQERQITIAGETHQLPRPFLVLATQNPIEQEGTYPLPEAQVDRFMFKVLIEYPQRSEELLILERMAHPEIAPTAQVVATMEDILTARSCLDQIYLDEKVADYIMDLVIGTRPGHRNELSSRQNNVNLSELDGKIEYGVSPRAVINLALAAKGAALMAGRAYVVPQDVKDIAPDVLRHRLTLSYEAEAENMDADSIIKILLDQLKTP